mgnify:CR=1 FL=1
MAIVATLSLGLMYIANFLDNQTNQIAASVESIRVAEELKSNLLIHSRETFLDLIQGKKIRMMNRSLIRHETQELLELAEKFISNEEEEIVINQLKTELAEYFRMREQMQNLQESPNEQYKEISKILDRSILIADKLIELNVDQSKEAQAISERQNDFADVFALTLIFITATVVIIILVLAVVTIYRPLRRLKLTLKEYSSGQAASRAEVKGLYEIRAIASSFNMMADVLEKRRDTQLRFISTIAHDLKNPLSAISMASSLLLERTNDKNDREIVQAIDRQVRGLDRLVGDLLDTTRIESGKIELKIKEQELNQIVNDGVELFKTSSTNHDFEIDLQPGLICKFDRERMIQVLNNLLSNAIKYSPYGGKIRVTGYRENHQIIIAIRDEGLGIPDDEIKEIFKPFNRTKTTRDTIPGIGLGLSSSRRVIEAQGGRLTVESRLGKGSTFYIVMPSIPTVN